MLLKHLLDDRLLWSMALVLLGLGPGVMSGYGQGHGGLPGQSCAEPEASEGPALGHVSARVGLAKGGEWLAIATSGPRVGCSSRRLAFGTAGSASSDHCQGTAGTHRWRSFGDSHFCDVPANLRSMPSVPFSMIDRFVGG